MKTIGQFAVLLLVLNISYINPGYAEANANSFSDSNTPYINHKMAKFRDLFVACVRDKRTGFSVKDLHQLIYLPVSLKYEANISNQISPRARLRIIDQRFKNITAKLYHNKSKQQAFSSVKCRSANRSPVTIIVLPGIFGEFSSSQPYGKLFAKSSRSIAGRKWLRAVSQLPANDKKRVSKSYVANLRPRGELRESDIVISPTTILDAVRVTSIDKTKNKELARLVLLYPRLFSADSIGTLHDNSQVYIKRLKKYFRIMGVPKRIVFIGYSRGASIALQMFVDAKAQKLPWIKNVEALVSIGGVVWGSALADDVTTNNKSKTYQFLRKLRALAKALDVIDRTDLTFGQKVRRVTLAYAKFSTVFFKVGSRAGSPVKMIKMAGILDKSSLKKIMRAFIKRHVRLVSRPIKAKEVKRNYTNDVIKFRQFIKNALAGIDGLTTQARLSWFRNNKLPRNIRYLSIAATMADGSLGKNNLAYSTEGFDFRLLSQSWKKYTRVSGISFGDSQVSVNRAIFWPKLLVSLNRSNSRLKIQNLAVMGIHHWGLVLQQAGTKGVNPFPREAMLRAMIHYLNKSR